MRSKLYLNIFVHMKGMNNMNEYIFTHGEKIYCPACLYNENGPLLICIERNYSGFAVDIGSCKECGKAYQISFKVDKVTRAKDWDHI